jgi:glycosyltransferase involved in cell wall biosynthesis
VKIGIDARFLTHPQPGGFKTYTENLIASLVEIDSVNEYVLYLDREPYPHDRIPRRENVHTRVARGTMPFLGLPWREQVSLVYQVRKDQIDLFHSLCLTAPLYLPCHLVITIHDMIWASPHYFTGNHSLSIKRRLIDWYNYLEPNYAIRKAAAIITVSHASKNSIIEILGMDSENIVVTHEAAGSAFRRIDDRAQLEPVRKKYDLPSSFLLAIGAADPRKNIEALIHAYALLPAALRMVHKLVIVWTHPFLTREISRLVDDLDLIRNVRFLRQVPNEDLVLLYNAAALFVFPSRYEGFGLPLLEAMACGVPVVAANNSSIHEVAGDAAVYFDANDHQTITDAMLRMLGDDAMKADLVHKGLARAATFSWGRCARETLDVYQFACR